MYQRRLPVVGSFLLAVALFVWPIASSGQTPALKTFSGGTTQGFAYSLTAGWEFQLSQAVEVTALGFWRGASDFTKDHQIGIWGTSPTPTLLASATVSPGDSLFSGYRYKQMETPVMLAAGTYRIGALLIAGDPPDNTTPRYSSATFDSRVTWLNGVRRFDEFGYPDYVDDPISPYGYMAPNFLLRDPQADPIPEPALVQLPFLLGLGGAGYWLRRRKVC